MIKLLSDYRAHLAVLNIIGHTPIQVISLNKLNEVNLVNYIQPRLFNTLSFYRILLRIVKEKCKFVSVCYITN